MDTIKWLLAKAHENDLSISITKSKNDDVVSLKIEKKLPRRSVSETIKFDRPLLNRIEAVSVGNLVGGAIDKIIENEKNNPHDA